jgi:hypothetical protein
MFWRSFLNVFFLLAIVLSVLPPSAVSYYPFGIFKLFLLQKKMEPKHVQCINKLINKVNIHFCVQWFQLRWEAIAHFVDIGWLDDHHCLNFLFIIYLDTQV